MTVDTLRGDRWGCTGDPVARTPFVDRLARRGLLAFEGRAPAPITLPSHATIMTGLAPVSHGVRENGVFRVGPTTAKTLAEALREGGYSTAAFVASYPLSARFGLDRGFEHYDDFFGGTEGESMGQFRERTASEVVARVRRHFDRGRAPAIEVPFFLWIHFFDPHAPYAAPLPWNAAVGGDAYRAEIASTDRAMTRLLRELELRRPGRRWTVFVTSDHGEGLGEHGEASHGVLLHSATLRVPFVASGGKQKPALVATQFPLEQLPGTILKILGMQPSLHPEAAPPLGERARPALSETMYPWYNYGWRALRSWEDGEWKLVSGVTDRLYRTSEDPQEDRDVAALHPDLVKKMKSALAAEWDRRQSFAFDASRDSLSSEDFEALRSLGYAAGSAMESKTTDEAFASGEDPQSRIHTVDRLNLAITILGEGNSGEAARILEEETSSDPSSRLAWEYLGHARLLLKQYIPARECLQRALRLGRNPSSVYLDLAEAERYLDNVEGERRALQGAVAVDPRSIPARLSLFRIALQEGNREEALRLLEESAKMRPRSESTQMNLAQYFEMVGDREKARQHWQRALELDPEGPVGQRARQALAQLEEKRS
jgi:arylsulfatase A-like enzyme/Flp pilus assembly protein TadD